AELVHFVGEHLMEEFRRYLAAVRKSGAVIEPLPDLCTADFRRCRVFHEIVERHRAASAEPGFDVLHADAAALAHALLGALALMRLQKLLLADMHVLALACELVRAGELAEDFHRHLDEIGMRDP